MTDNTNNYYQPKQRLLNSDPTQPLNPYLYLPTEPIIYNKYNDLYSCFDNDFSVCLCGFFYPICMNSNLSYKIATNGKNIKGCSWLSVPLVCSSFYNRKFINQSFGVNNSNCQDCLTTTLCYPCSVIQNENNYKLIH